MTIGRSPVYVDAVGKDPALIVVALACIASSCSVDTELGVAVALESASVRVTGAGPSATVTGQTTATFRVGEYAQSPQTFIPTSLEVYAGDLLIVGFVPDGSDGGVLAPGEERSVLLDGGPEPVADADVICGQEVRIRLVYRFSEGAGVSATPTLRDAELSTRDVQCE